MTEYAGELLPEAREGWSWPMHFRRAHYFHRGISLCEEYEITDHDGEPDRIDRRHRDRCPRCDTRLATLRRYRRGEGRGVKDTGERT